MINTSSKGTVHRQKSGNDKAQCDTLHINFAEQAENTTNQRTFASSLFSPFNYSFLNVFICKFLRSRQSVHDYQ